MCKKPDNCQNRSHIDACTDFLFVSKHAQHTHTHTLEKERKANMSMKIDNVKGWIPTACNLQLDMLE